MTIVHADRRHPDVQALRGIASLVGFITSRRSLRMTTLTLPGYSEADQAVGDLSLCRHEYD